MAAGRGLRLHLFRGVVEMVGGFAQAGRCLAQGAGADRGVGIQIGVGGPGDPEGEPGQGFQRLPERCGGGVVDGPGHGGALAAGARSMRSPQGSRFQSPGTSP